MTNQPNKAGKSPFFIGFDVGSIPSTRDKSCCYEFLKEIINEK